MFTGSINEDWIYDSDGKPLYWPVDGYFNTGQRTTHFLGQDVVKQHHTLSQILGGLLRAGFTITTVDEAVPSTEMMHIPGMSDELRRPMMLIVKCIK